MLKNWCNYIDELAKPYNKYIMKHLRILAFILAISVCLSAFAADLFTVDGVKVSSSGSSAKQAKDAAMMAGQREAFAKLLERIASTKTTVDSSAIDTETLTNMVQGIEVNDEKVTSSYYSATLSISFNQSFVDKYLKDRNISFTDKKSAPIVIAPVLMDASSFEGKNQWRSAIETATSANHVLSVTVLPSLRGIDKSRIPQDITSLEPATRDALLKIGQSYNADKFILAVAVQDTDHLTVRMQDIKNPKSVVKELSFLTNDLQSAEDAFGKAAKNVTSILEGQWVGSKNEDAAPLSKITLTVPVTGLSAWESTRKRLENIGQIKDINVKSLSVKSVIADISYRDTLENLSVKLQENGMSLEKVNDNTIALHIMQ